MIADHVDETDHLTDLDSDENPSDENPLDEYITEVEESSQLTPTETCSVDDSFFSEFLRSSAV